MLRNCLILSLLLAVAAVAASVQTASVQTASVQTASVRATRARPKRARIPDDQAVDEQAVDEQTASVQTNVVVVVSSKSSVKSLTAEQTTKIFLGKVVTFPNGQSAFPVDQPEGSPIRDEFYSKVARKNSSQLTAYWAKVIFTGDGRPPILLPDNLAVRKAIATNPNAIGYIDKSAVNRSVRIVLEP